MNSSKKTTKNWKGEAEVISDPPRHQWEIGARESTQVRAARPSYTNNNVLLFFFCAAIAGLIGFVFFLLHSPKKMPFVIVAPNSYRWPFPISSWRGEDVKNFSFLADKTLQFADCSSAWRSRGAAIEDLRKQLSEFAPSAKVAQASVLYLCMLPSISDDLEPCVIPPGADPLDPSQWIRFSEIVSVIKEKLPGESYKLIVIDPIQLNSNWHLGILQSTFSERLGQWVKELNDPTIAIMLAASDHETALAGADVRASIFGLTFQRALSGEADHYASTTSPDEVRGNGDGVVSVRELAAYVRDNVNRWATETRGVTQTPCLYMTSRVDFPLVWSLSYFDRRQQESQYKASGIGEASLSTTELQTVWSKMDQLSLHELFHYDPCGWADLQRDIVDLAGFSRAGSAYSEQTKLVLFAELSKSLASITEEIERNGKSNELLPKYEWLSKHKEPKLATKILPSLALKELVGEVSSEQAGLMRTQVRQNFGQPGGVDSESIGASIGLIPSSSFWNESNFVGLLNTFNCKNSWQNVNHIESFLDARDRWEQIVTRGDLRAHRWLRPQFDEIDKKRRLAEDLIFAGETGQAIASIQDFIASVGFAENQDQGVKKNVAEALLLLDRACLKAIPLGQWLHQTISIGDELATGDQLMEGLAGIDVASLANLPANELAKSVSDGLRRKLLERYREFLSNINKLDHLLSDPSCNSDVILGNGRLILERVQSDLAFFDTAIRDEVSRLTAQRVAGNAIVRIERLLEIPFLDSKDLLALTEKLQKLYDSKRQQWLDTRDTVGSRTRPSNLSPQSGTSQYATNFQNGLDSNLNVSLHPVFLILNRARDAESKSKGNVAPETELASAPSQSTAEKSVRKPLSPRDEELIQIENNNRSLRRLLIAITSLDANRIEDWLSSSQIPSSTNELVDPFGGAFVAEQMERRLAYLSPRRPENSPVLALRDYAFTDMLNWYAKRTLEDFYADDDGFSATAVKTNPFFAKAFNQIASVRRTLQGSEASENADLSRQQQALDVLVPATRSGFQTTVRMGPLSPDGTEREIAVTVSQWALKSQENATPTIPLPQGIATVFAREGDLIQTQPRLTVDVPIAKEDTTLATSLPARLASKNLQVVTVFRGHEFRTAVAAQRGVTFEFEPKSFETAEIVLFGDRASQPTTSIILDCSWSMGEQIPIEAIDVSSQSRLETAKTNIIRMLSQLAEQSDARVGVRLFGHRVGWSKPSGSGGTTGKTQIMFQPSYGGSIPDDLVPSRDVEAILPLGRFNASMIGPISERLSTVVPWGQSPLYYAISEAFLDFSSNATNESRCILVITDGDNFQFAASNRPGGEPNNQTTLEDVERAWARVKVPVFILGVGINEDQSPEIKRNLQRLTQSTGGRYFDIINETDLVRALSERLAVGTFSLSPVYPSASISLSRLSTSQESPFNKAIEIKIDRSKKQEFEIGFRSVRKTIQVEGGESLEMRLSPDGKDILSIPFDQNSPRAGILVRDDEATKLIARVHRPVIQGRGVTFPISFQDQDLHYTKRPKELWVEIVASDSNPQSSATKHVYYDTEYESGLPVPLVKWQIPDWPTESKEALVQAWVKYEETPPRWTIPLAQVVQESQKYADGIELDGGRAGIVRVRMIEKDSLDTATIQVTEMHEETSFSSNYRVMLDLGNLGSAKRVTRHYEVGGRMVSHSFTLSRDLFRRAISLGGVNIKIVTKEDFVRGAFRLQTNQPISVPLAPESNTVRSTSEIYLAP